MSLRTAAARRLAYAQGGFYLLTGVWPLMHLPSFLAVTGPKVDQWLVQTVGALLATFGAVLILAAARQRLTPEWRLLAVGFAIVLAAVDVVFVTREVIPPIYLLDALAEAALVLGWLAAEFARRSQR